MRPLKRTAALAAMLLILSYSITTACDTKTKKPANSAQTADVVDVTVSCDVAADALASRAIVIQTERHGPAEGASQTATAARTSIRAGATVSRALARTMAHLAVAIARTAYHTVTALT